MGKSRKRITKRDKPVKEGIPVAKLGKEFEWIDPKLKVGLEAYPTFKRPIGKAEINMMLALNMYYDTLTEKWQPLDSLDISTVKNLARYYAVNPPDLTVDIYENLRIDKNQNLFIDPITSTQFLEGYYFTGNLVAQANIDETITGLNFIINKCQIAIGNAAGAMNATIILAPLTDALDQDLAKVVSNITVPNPSWLDYDIPACRSFRVKITNLHADQSLKYIISCYKGAFYANML